MIDVPFLCKIQLSKQFELNREKLVEISRILITLVLFQVIWNIIIFERWTLYISNLLRLVQWNHDHYNYNIFSRQLYKNIEPWCLIYSILSHIQNPSSCPTKNRKQDVRGKFKFHLSTAPLKIRHSKFRGCPLIKLTPLASKTISPLPTCPNNDRKQAREPR